MLLLVLLVAVVWLVAGLAVVGLCRAAADGDAVEVAARWDDFASAA